MLTFIRRLIRHIPDKHFKMIRYAGLFATRWKARYLSQARVALGQPPVCDTESAESPSVSLLPWRQRRLAEGGADPLLCRICQIPMRFVGAIFGSHQKIAGYFEAAGIPTAPTHPAWDTG